MPLKAFYRVFFAILFIALPSFAALASDKPLLMEGKTSLYQRVLTTPHAELVPKIGQTGGKQIATFSVYYIYDRQEQGNISWVKVGTSTNGNIAGWIKEELTVPWKQQIVLAFSNSAGRERNLLFSTKKFLSDVWNHETPESIVAPLRKKTLENKRPEGIVSIEPENYVNFQDPDNFYLLPILGYEEHLAGNIPVNLLEIASVTEKSQDDEDANVNAQSQEPKPRQIKAFNAAVVFVIDTTISMGPYIEKTQEAVKNIYDKIGENELADQIKFGLVAYRSSTDEVPELEYRSKLYVDPNEVESGEDFLQKVKDLKPASVSTPSFNEDAYSGIMTALNEIEWKEFGGRYIVLVSDAGAIEGDDPLSGTKLGSDNIRQEAKERGIALFTMHLKTEAGKKNHNSTEMQYQDVSSNPYTDDLYYSIEAGNVDEYAQIVEALSETLTSQVDMAFEGEETAGSARTSTEDAQEEETPEEDSNAERIKKDSFLIGHAMRLAYLGRVEDTKAPDFFKAWISDSDFANPEKATVDYRVLLTRKQLNDLDLILSELLTEFEKDQSSEEGMSSSDFFDTLRSISAKMGRDPGQLSDSTTTQLGKAGLFDEYLMGLPYWSELMELTFERWEEKGYMEKDTILNSIRRKLRHYKLINEDSDRWVILTEGAPASEAVYPIPLELMP